MHTSVSSTNSDAQPAVIQPNDQSALVVNDQTKIAEPLRLGLVASGVEGISLTGCGLVVEKDEISPAEYNTLFYNVLALHKSSCWLLGDTLLFADRRWGNQYTGSKYEEAAQATGMSATTLRHIVRTCERFPLETRRPELSFTHHREIANTDADYEQRAAVLEQAASEKMSCATLRKHLHQTRFTEPDEPEEEYDENEEPCKVLDPENPMSIINLPERSAPDAPPLWDALKFVDWVDKQDPEEYDLEQCQQAIKLAEPIVAYHAAVLERLKELENPPEP